MLVCRSPWQCAFSFLVAGCLALHNDEGGTWTPASCTTGSSKLESSCKLKCNPGFQLRGASSVECTERGWNSVNGGSIPKCVREYGRVESALGFLLPSEENYRLLFKFRPPSLN
jgi:hypothetical protein